MAITLPWALITLAVLVLAAILVMTVRLSLTGGDSGARPLATAPPVFGPPSDPPVVPPPAVADEGTTRASSAPSPSPTRSRSASVPRRPSSPRAPAPTGTSANGCTVVSVNGVTTTTCDKPGCRVRTNPTGVSVNCSERSSKSRRTRDR